MRNKKLALERIDAYPVEKRGKGQICSPNGNCCILGAILGLEKYELHRAYYIEAADFLSVPRSVITEIYERNDDFGWENAREFIASLPEEDA